MYPGGTSGRGIHQTRSRTAHASEPEQNPKDLLQRIEKLSITRFQQASSLVQMQRKRVASEPCHKAESGSQPTHNKRVARFSATTPVVQILGAAGMPRNANVPWRHPGGTSGRGIHQTRSRTAHASEPELNPRNSPQHIEKLSIARFQQASSLVQMQRKMGASEQEQNPRNSLQHIERLSIAKFRQASPLVQMRRKRDASEPEQNPRNPPQHIEKLSITRFQQASPPVQMRRKRDASEPYRKTESGTQSTHNKRVARISATTPVVQIPGGSGMPRNAMHPGGTSGRGIHQTRSRTAQASEPELNPRNSLQHIETLSIARLQQASPLVQMQWKRVASEPYRKTESGSQPTHNKHIARFSTTAPVVQIPTGSGMPRNANTPWRHFWQGYPPNAQQNGPCI